MKIIDAIGKPCPIPVIEAKKALAGKDTAAINVKVDNIVAVQNLEKMAIGMGYTFYYNENAKNSYDVIIGKDEKAMPVTSGASETKEQKDAPENVSVKEGTKGLVVVIGRNAMGDGAEELGKILIKGFIYSLTELPVCPKCVIFLNSGAYLTADGSNTIDDLKKLEKKGAEILTCGTCINYYKLESKPAAGTVTDMYGITERMASADNIINI